ncbi:MAG: hypothetical protein ABI323_03960 [Solirubrobacteraceae bacterium]
MAAIRIPQLLADQTEEPGRHECPATQAFAQTSARLLECCIPATQ